MTEKPDTAPVSQATRGLAMEEGTIFDRSSAGRVGFELPLLEVPAKRPQEGARSAPAELPEVSELDTVRHFTRLSSWNYSIDTGTFPLGSCTMKYNPRINEELAALPGLANIHPDMPAETCQGALEVIHRCERVLCDISGLDECSVQPAAGAHGEFTGLAIIRAFHESLGSARNLVLVPDSAHGTNPATCTLVGYKVVQLKTGANGIATVESVEEAIEKHGRDIAAMMVTNPSTLGLFESNLPEIADRLHAIGAQIYMDGANMNAVLGVAKARDLGVDVQHFNLHKTFSTPHGGGGPGAGPVAVRSHLAPFLPNPRVRFVDGKYSIEQLPQSVGKVKSGMGNFGVIVRALAYILHHGAPGLKRVSQAAVLNANYLRVRLQDLYPTAVERQSMHECVLTDQKFSKKNGVKTLQIAKALIDRGYHPPTIYFPLIVPGAMLIEPTETESLRELDGLVAAFRDIARLIESGETFENAPTKTIVGKVDEVGAARRPILTVDDRTR